MTTKTFPSSTTLKMADGSKMRIKHLIEIDELGNYFVERLDGRRIQLIGGTEVKGATITFRDEITYANDRRSGVYETTRRVKRTAKVVAAAKGKIDAEWTTTNYGDRAHNWGSFKTIEL